MGRLKEVFIPKLEFDLLQHTFQMRATHLVIANLMSGEVVRSHDCEDGPVGLRVSPGYLSLGEIYFSEQTRTEYITIPGVVAPLRFALLNDAELALKFLPDGIGERKLRVLNLSHYPVKLHVEQGKLTVTWSI